MGIWGQIENTAYHPTKSFMEQQMHKRVNVHQPANEHTNIRVSLFGQWQRRPLQKNKKKAGEWIPKQNSFDNLLPNYMGNIL